MSPSKSHKRGKKKKSKPSSLSPPHNQQLETLGNEFRANGAKYENEDEDLEKKRVLDMKWLLSAFETISMEEIVSVYFETGYDAFKAAGVLGDTLIDTEIEENKEFCTAKNNKKKKNKVGVSCGMVANVIGKEYLKKNLNLNLNSNFGEERANRKDRKYSIVEGEEFLCAMLGDNSELGMGVVKDVLDQCGFDVEKALDALLDISDTSFNQFTERSDVDYQYIDPELSSCSSSENSIGLFQITNKTTDFKHHPPDKGINISTYEGNGCRNDITSSEQQLPSQSRRVDSYLQQNILESLFNIRDNTARDANSMDWKRAVKQVKPFGQGLEFRDATITHPLLTAINGKKDEYEVFHSVAREHKERMKYYFQKAAAAFSRGEGANAAQLSEMGREYRRLARNADEEASQEIFEARNKGITNIVTIDLHGQHVKQGIDCVKKQLILFKYSSSVHILRVITGCGGNSNSGKGKLKRAVTALAKKEGIEWRQENSGTLLLKIDGSKEYSFIDEDDEEEDDY